MKASEKWRRIANGTGIDKGGDNCHLCDKFLVSSSDNRHCQDCPIFRESKLEFCESTPYHSWVEHQVAQHQPSVWEWKGEQWKAKVECEECLLMALTEYFYLLSIGQ